MNKIDFATFKGGMIEGSALLVGVSEEIIAKNNNPYIRLTFSDGSMKQEINLFKRREDFGFEVGTVLDLKLQHTGKNINILEYSPSKEQNPADFVVMAEIPGEKSFNEIMGTLANMKKTAYPNNDSHTLYDVAMTMLTKYRERLVKYPASAKYNHVYEGGLIYYINMMVKDAFLMSMSHKTHGDWEVVISALAVCEIGKLMGLDYNGYEMPETTFFADTRSEVEYAATEAEQIMNGWEIDPLRRENFLVCIRSSRLKKEWGATVNPITLEAHYVSSINHMEAKADIYIGECKKLQIGEGTKEPPKDCRIWHNVYRLS